MRKKVETPVTSRHHVTGGGGRGVRDQGLVPNPPFRPLLEALGVLTWSAPRRGIQRSRCAPLRYGGERLLMLGGGGEKVPLPWWWPDSALGCCLGVAGGAAADEVCGPMTEGLVRNAGPIRSRSGRGRCCPDQGEPHGQSFPLSCQLVNTPDRPRSPLVVVETSTVA